MGDRSISKVHSALGFEDESAEPRLDRLDEEGLICPSKAQTVTPEIETVGRLLDASFVRNYRIPHEQAECRRHNID